MLNSRRRFLLGLPGAVLAYRAALAGAAQPPTSVNFAMPAGACDCHTHVFGDPARYPFFAGRTYTPEPALVEEMTAMHRRVGLQRVVIVQPSVYGTDNAAALDAIKARGADARGIAVIGAETTEQEIDALHRAGMRGIRLNLATGGTNDPDEARARLGTAIDRMRGRAWHIQIFTGLGIIAALKNTIASSPVPVVIDHFGGAKAALGLEQPGFADLQALLRTGRVYVKISGANSASDRAPDYPDVAPLARALIAANPDRILWGSNWPHRGGTAANRPKDWVPPPPVDDGRMLNLLASWAPDAAVRRRILVENPARLFGF